MAACREFKDLACREFKDLKTDPVDLSKGRPAPERTMKISLGGVKRPVAGCVFLAMLAPCWAVAQQSLAAAQQTNTGQSGGSNSSAQALSPEPARNVTNTLPDSPGSVRSQMIADNRSPSQQNPQSSPAQSQSSEAQQSSSQAPSQASPTAQNNAQNNPQNNSQQPVGTAAAGPVKATGIAASQPAGAAIAPAKQRRTRSIIIKVGALAGAAVAVGTIVALSAASPSRPR